MLREITLGELQGQEAKLEYHYDLIDYDDASIMSVFDEEEQIFKIFTLDQDAGIYKYFSLKAKNTAHCHKINNFYLMIIIDWLDMYVFDIVKQCISDEYNLKFQDEHGYLCTETQIHEHYQNQLRIIDLSEFPIIKQFIKNNVQYSIIDTYTRTQVTRIHFQGSCSMYKLPLQHDNQDPLVQWQFLASQRVLIDNYLIQVNKKRLIPKSEYLEYDSSNPMAIFSEKFIIIYDFSSKYIKVMLKNKFRLIRKLIKLEQSLIHIFDIQYLIAHMYELDTSIFYIYNIFTGENMSIYRLETQRIWKNIFLEKKGKNLSLFKLVPGSN